MEPVLSPPKVVPSEDELAAIAAAYVAMTAADHAPAQAPPRSRWRLAARLPDAAHRELRTAAAAVSRWNLAGRLDG